MASANDTIHCVYRIVCFATGKCYVGQTIEFHKRKLKHLRELRLGQHHSAHLQRAYKKYGKRSFYFEILEEDIPSSEVNNREKWWIHHFDSYNNGYNMAIVRSSGKAVSTPFTWNGVDYPSISEAARANGVLIGTMVNRAKVGHTCDSEIQPLRYPVTWNGIHYSSKAEAANAIGITLSALTWRLERGYTCDDDVGINIPVSWNGIQYPSIKEAAKALGMTKTKMGRLIRQGKTCDADITKKASRKK